LCNIARIFRTDFCIDCITQREKLASEPDTYLVASIYPY
jgi:hypothetical protein